ncbi:biotin-dependent enzyme [Balneicella halophila]|uniref:Biotin-dependent enzyme n=1 Tax=Balneicella halophila TaxID=1537566 RepID=A0A7L4UPC7_BALHA|nr:biotin/lipoyl-containing protein [Balneicella halophila]PVX50985.1 biotin-dependent enzyme [Balneicella halophila]
MTKEKKKRNKSLIVSGQKFYTQLTPKFESRTAWEKANPKHLRAIIPGNIEDIVAVEKKRYKKGDVLLTFKAMKMLNTVLMPFSGVVKKIHVKKGDVLTKNQLMVEIE